MKRVDWQVRKDFMSMQLLNPALPYDIRIDTNLKKRQRLECCDCTNPLDRDIKLMAD